ncbi:hypothetical protein ACJIZ3_015554 [Penstemon smallii]|uniref:Uncharacterized protein n=1 Tax=Penstemon smallii TaxID=265156 RepID=A0ABD3RTI0_9LAMI
MGLIEHHESNGVEKLESCENLVQNPNCECLTPDNCEMDSQKVVIEPVEQKDITGVQNIETILVPMEENLSKIIEMGPKPGDVSQDRVAEERGPLLKNVKLSSVLEKSEVPLQDRPKNLEITVVPPDTASLGPVNGRIEPTERDRTNELDHFHDEDEDAQARKGAAKLKSPVTSSWSLRSKSQEKPKAPEPNDDIEEGSANREKKRRARKKKQIKKDNVNEFSRTRNNLRYLLHRIKYEQSLIDAYSAEGWKGQSLEKLKPEKELQLARSHILRYKLKIRELFQRLDTSLAAGKLPASLFDSQGEIDSEDIFCAKCGSKDLPLDNDIILCDGACERGFHQFCVEPPLLKEDIPPGDESWLCPGCDCKADCIDMLKDFQKSNISILDKWEKIFPEAASGKKLDGNSGSSSGDSEDDDFDPDKPNRVAGDQSSSNESNYLSASDGLVASPSNEKLMGFPSDDSEDDDFDPTAPDPDTVKQDSSTSDFTSDSEDLGALIDDATAPGEDSEENSKEGGMKRQLLNDEVSYLMETTDKPESGKRRVKRLDYKNLHEETYGNSTSDSSDEDYDDTTPKRRKINGDSSSGVDPTAPSPDETSDFTSDSEDAPLNDAAVPGEGSEENSKEGRIKSQLLKDEVSYLIKTTDEPASDKRRVKRWDYKKLHDETYENSSSDSSDKEFDDTAPKKRKINKTSIKKSKMDTKDENQEKSLNLPKRNSENDDDGGANQSSATVGSDSKVKKRSANKGLGEAAKQRLYEYFNENQYPGRAAKEKLANEIGLTVLQVSRWFANTRFSFNHRPQSNYQKPPEPQPTIGTEIIDQTPDDTSVTQTTQEQNV